MVTLEILQSLQKQGVKDLVVACPSFVADCLETLEEIQITLQEKWLQLGGESCYLIPCLNSSPDWVAALCTIIEHKIQSKELIAKRILLCITLN